MYTSSVLSWTIAPCGHAARISADLATGLPSCAASAANRRNSVGVTATLTVPELTFRAVGSKSMPAASNSRSEPARRISASNRAATSAMSKGLQT